MVCNLLSCHIVPVPHKNMDVYMFWYFIFGDTLNLFASIKINRYYLLCLYGYAGIFYTAYMWGDFACMKYQSLVFPCQPLHALGVLSVLFPFLHLRGIITTLWTVISQLSSCYVFRCRHCKRIMRLQNCVLWMFAYMKSISDVHMWCE